MQRHIVASAGCSTARTFKVTAAPLSALVDDEIVSQAKVQCHVLYSGYGITRAMGSASRRSTRPRKHTRVRILALSWPPRTPPEKTAFHRLGPD